MSGFIGDHMMTSILGNGIAGLQSPGGLLGGGAGLTGGSGMEGGSARSRTRKELRKAFGNNRILKNYYSPTYAVSGGGTISGIKTLRKITPFRAAMNAGDIAGTTNSFPSPTLPGSNQVKPQSILNLTWGGVHNTGEALYSGNQKYVYDSSNYIRFKRLQAENRNYNDKSFGGDEHHASKVPLSSVRH